MIIVVASHYIPDQLSINYDVEIYALIGTIVYLNLCMSPAFTKRFSAYGNGNMLCFKKPMIITRGEAYH